MHRYIGFGLKIESEIEFPELFISDFENAEMIITLGKTPDSLNVPFVSVFESSKGILDTSFIGEFECLLNTKELCKLYISNGNKIVVEILDGADQDTLRIFILTFGLPALLYQTGNIPIHTGGVIYGEQLILFGGKSGAGKSTLMAELLLKGYDIFTDDTCILKSNNNDITASASYPMAKLMGDTINKLNSTIFTKDNKVRPKVQKYRFYFHNKFQVECFNISAILILSPEEGIKSYKCRQV